MVEVYRSILTNFLNILFYEYSNRCDLYELLVPGSGKGRYAQMRTWMQAILIYSFALL